MAPEAFANFDAAIQARAAAGHTMTTTRGLDRRRHASRRPSCRVDGAGRRALRRQARLGDARQGRRGRRGLGNGRGRPSRPVDVRARRALPRPQLAADGDPVGASERDLAGARLALAARVRRASRVSPTTTPSPPFAAFVISARARSPQNGPRGGRRDRPRPRCMRPRGRRCATESRQRRRGARVLRATGFGRIASSRRPAAPAS